MDARSEGKIYEFDRFSADTLKRRLYRDGEHVPLSSKAFDTLTAFLTNSGKTLTRDALIEAVWDDTIVDNNNLNQQISALRKVLGEQRGGQEFVVTVPGKGYSFVVPVREIYQKKAAMATQVLSGAVKMDRNRRFGFAVALLYILVVCLPFVYSSVRNTAFGNQPQSLAVLQFRADRGDEFIGTGITDTLRARLGSVEDLMVRPRTTLTSDVLTAGRELNVDSIVTGSVQRANDRIRITVEMVDVGNGRVVWGKTFDDEAKNIFALQDSIVGEVASALHVRLTSRLRSSRETLRAYTS